MKSMLQTAFLWCMLTALLPSITSAKPLNTDGLRRFSVWLQSRVKRERSESDMTDLLTQRNCDTESLVPQHRNARVKRTDPAYSIKRVERAGCNLATCSVHELAHLLNIMHAKTNNAPTDKIGSNGYGRRRRRSLPSNQPALTFHEGRLKLAWVRSTHKGN